MVGIRPVIPSFISADQNTQPLGTQDGFSQNVYLLQTDHNIFTLKSVNKGEQQPNKIAYYLLV